MNVVGTGPMTGNLSGVMARVPGGCGAVTPRANWASLSGCGRADLPKPEWGRYTQQGNRLYAHIYERGIGPINFRGLSGKIKSARLLADGSELELDRSFMTADYPDDAFINFLTSRLPDEIDTVVELALM